MTPNNSPIIYSIGHSKHEAEAFIALLRRHGVITLADVRSQPYSRRTPQANRETLAQALQAAGLTYVFMGDSLGGRPDAPALYQPGGEPDYVRMAATPAFQAGIQQLLELARDGVVVVMCAEGDYCHCHRSKLITPQLLGQGARVIHILPDGKTTEARPEPKQLSLF